MQPDSLARRALAKLDADYADQRLNEMFMDWWRDIGARPDTYRAAIPTAELEHQPLLTDVMPHMIEYGQAQTDDERAAVDAKHADIVARCQARQDMWIRVWFDLYFVPGSDLDVEFSRCCLTLQQAGKLPGI